MSRALAAVALLASVEASAQYVRTPAGDPANEICVTWTTRNITYTPDSAGSARTPGDTEFVAMDAAFATWQALSKQCSDFQFTKGPSQANTLVGQGTQDSNVVVFRDTECTNAAPPNDPCFADDTCINMFHCWDHGQFTLALTTVTYSTKTGAIYDADIELNSADWLFTTVDSPPCVEGMEAVTCVATDVQNTLTHEIGHFLGFDHVNNPNSTMAPTAPIGETSKRVLDPGTQDGFCTTYPRGQPPTPCDASSVQRSITATVQGTPGLTAFGCTSLPGDMGWSACVFLILENFLSRRRRLFSAGRR
jgi:hypothetical protein